jgi:hypothetical protein
VRNRQLRDLSANVLIQDRLPEYMTVTAGTVAAALFPHGVTHSETKDKPIPAMLSSNPCPRL